MQQLNMYLVLLWITILLVTCSAETVEGTAYLFPFYSADTDQNFFIEQLAKCQHDLHHYKELVDVGERQINAVLQRSERQLAKMERDVPQVSERLQRLTLEAFTAKEENIRLKMQIDRLMRQRSS